MKNVHKGPKISVIVPVYNLERELMRCVDSILAQTHANMEIVLVDDGSTDASSEVIKTLLFQDCRIRSYRIPHQGAFQARLAGVKEATGEWISFVDGDDCIDPNMYERLLLNAAHYGAEIAHCGYVMDYPNGRSVYFHGSEQIKEQSPMDFLREIVSGRKVEWWSVVNKLYHKSLFDKKSIFDKLKSVQVELNEDLLLNFLLVRNVDKLVYEDCCWYHYRVREQSTSKVDSAKKRLDRIEVYRMIRDYAPEPLLRSAQRTFLLGCIKEYTDLYKEKQSKEIQDKIRQYLIDEESRFSLLEHDMAQIAEIIVKCPKAYETVVYNAERIQRGSLPYKTQPYKTHGYR